MKKWLAILSIICVSGFVISTILAGRVYYQDLQVYEDQDKRILNISSNQDIYIQSDIPVEVHQATGNEAYVEFSQKFVDLIGKPSKYELEVEDKGNSTYITLNQIEETLLWVGVKQNKAKLDIYLPKINLNHLEIENTDHYSFYDQNQMIDLGTMQIKEVEIDMSHANFELNGAYENVNINADYGKLKMNTSSATQVVTSGQLTQVLNGKFDNVVIKNNNSDISIQSLTPSNIEINNDNGEIKLDGQYSRIKLNGMRNDIDLQTDTECVLSTSGAHNTVVANGLFRTIDLEEQSGEIEIKNMMIPKSIQMVGASYNTSLNLTLPSNIPGVMLKYVRESKEECDEYGDYTGDWEENKEYRKIESDFTLVEQKEKGEQVAYQYGNGQIPLIVNKDRDISIKLIDGGYSSTLN